MIEGSPRAEAGQGFIFRDACPCCGAPVARSAPKAHSSPRAEDIAPEDHGRFLSGYGARRVFFSYRRCADCEMVYCPLYYGEAMLARLYAHQPENMAEAPLEARRRTQAGYAELVPDAVPPGGDFLEVGADIGLLAQACAARWPFRRLVLYEPNVGVHPELRQHLVGNDLVVREGLFRAADQGAETVSLAAMIHVLDHILDPADVLRALHAVLKPGGVLLVVTHDVASPLARLLGRRWPPFTLQHPHLFSPASMRRMLAETGFRDIRVHRSVNHFPLTYLAQAALSVLAVQRKLIPQLAAPTVGLRLGNIATIARKPA